MGYIEDLRKNIGTKPIIMVGSNVIIRNDKGEILLHHRVDRDWWGLPGGAMELNETTEETAIRETFEEVGLVLKDLELFGVYSGKEFYYKYPDGNEVHNVTISYLCSNYTGDIKIDYSEGTEACFFNVAELPQNISSTIEPILKDYIEVILKMNDEMLNDKS